LQTAGTMQCHQLQGQAHKSSLPSLDCSILKKKALQSTCYNTPEDFNFQTTNIFLC